MIAGISSILEQIIVYSTIYTLVALGIVISGRAGIFNVGGEGIMLASASAGFLAAFFTESWLLGFMVGGFMGAVLGGGLAILHEYLRVNQFVAGIFLVIFGTGLSDLMYKLIVGIRLEAPQAPAMPEILVPVVRDIPIVQAFFNQDPIVYFMYLMTLGSWWFFYRTRLGLETRAIGELPQAADVVGVNVRGRRILAAMVGAALMGVAGAYLPIFVTGTYNPNISGGRGFMAIGIAIFAAWKPHRTLIGGFIFATVEVLSYQLQLAAPGVPFQFFLMLPFLSVIVIMVVFRRHIEFPASIGTQYHRE
jgi:ABC-type uncharacterized transport system permease subunit